MITVNKKFWEELSVYYSWYEKDSIENDKLKNPSSVSCTFVAAVMFQTSRFLARGRGIYTELLPSNDGVTHTDTQSHARNLRNRSLRWAQVHYVYVLRLINIG
jgi:hypothetical protein